MRIWSGVAGTTSASARRDGSAVVQRHDHFGALLRGVGGGQGGIDLDGGDGGQAVDFGVGQVAVVGFLDHAARERRRDAEVDAHFRLQGFGEGAGVVAAGVADGGGGGLHLNRGDIRGADAVFAG